jgi:hypothetical protein
MVPLVTTHYGCKQCCLALLHTLCAAAGGIVKENWTKLDWTKLRLMIDQFGLWPWYKW